MMVKRETQIRYKNTLLGVGWIIINPLVQMLVFGVIFQFMLKTKIENYFLFIFSGLSLWNYFSLTIMKCVSIIVNQRAFIQKANFPREILVLSIVVSNLLSLLLSAILCVVVLAVGPHVVLASNWWELLLVFVWILLLTSGLSLALAAINVKHRDVAFVVGAIIPLWFYATPIVYELKMLPARFGSYLYLNPLTGIVEVFRHAVMGIDPLNWNMCWWSSLESVVVFVLGGIIFFRLSPWFDDWV